MQIYKDCDFTVYGTDTELDKVVDSQYVDDRIEMARQKYGLNKLVNDEYEYVRVAVAEQGYGLDTLIKDEDWHVREAVTRQGYRLDELISDKDYRVVYATEEYLKANNYRSVFAWARDNDINLDIDLWLHSEIKSERVQVAKEGYGLDKLISDDYVKYYVENYLEEHNYKSIKDWINDNR